MLILILKIKTNKSYKFDENKMKVKIIDYDGGITETE